MAKTLIISGQTYTNVAGFKATDSNDTVQTYIQPEGSTTITSNGTNIDIAQYATVDVAVPVGSTISNQNKTVNPSITAQTITADSGYTGLGEVTITAMPAGTAGTPTATKGIVTNNSILVTPSVTNTTGYITGSTINGTAVSVAAGELVSGTKSISANGTNIDVTNYASVDVAVPTPTPNLQTITKSYTPAESEQTETITAGSGYDGIEEVDITINAIPVMYVGSGVARRDGSSLYLKSSTGLVTIPAGYYSTA